MTAPTKPDAEQDNVFPFPAVWRSATKEETDAAYQKLQREAVERNPFYVRKS